MNKKNATSKAAKNVICVCCSSRNATLQLDDSSWLCVDFVQYMSDLGNEAEK